MPETKYVIDDILNAIVNEKPVDLQTAVNSMMVDKAHDEIEFMKTQLMQDMYAKDDDEEVEDSEEEVEADEDEEDTDVEELDAEEIFNDEDEPEEETDNQG
jgi:hypothetical protein